MEFAATAAPGALAGRKLAATHEAADVLFRELIARQLLGSGFGGGQPFLVGRQRDAHARFPLRDLATRRTLAGDELLFELGFAA